MPLGIFYGRCMRPDNSRDVTTSRIEMGNKSAWKLSAGTRYMEDDISCSRLIYEVPSETEIRAEAMGTMGNLPSPCLAVWLRAHYIHLCQNLEQAHDGRPGMGITSVHAGSNASQVG